MFSIEHLNVLRATEIEVIVPHLSPGARVLEIGAGTGRQALELQRRGFDVIGIEIAGSPYAAERVFPVREYDGAHLPFPATSFDVVFSSNALEHVRDLTGIHSEIRRVLKPEGVAIHVLPTHAWRFWSIVTSFPSALVYLFTALRRIFPGSRDTRSLRRAWYEAAREAGAALLQPRHGERGHGITELWLFHPWWWRRNFRRNGFTLISEEPMGLFYTGPVLLGAHLSLVRRAKLAKMLGSACHLYVLRSNQLAQP